ncbi:NAD-dependent epimerase/dehydratase family protein [Mycobacterium sp. ITM-2016-00316]|uniref:NAD-dependent epimerase/dehydratase family protein n=1 Tax=Mycobacterium sp. ITM-2016-00316 TaxID=2099695 RepID=UPI001304C31C|nr:NAD-dependent epimerase/dehydratase family protein [Mycobacterium sp. ITM-2016-00316]WNG84191.1 NAD-dependent epimerase/dehydratase family protein [Mycobacterium sp. ITM-2016-00316]
MRDGSTVLVTGAAGFIGSNLVGALSEALPTARIVGLDREPNPGNYKRWLTVDLADKDEVRQTLATLEVDLVIHLAAQAYVPGSLERPEDYVRDNVLATSNLLVALQERIVIPPIILASSCEVYGDQLDQTDEAVDPAPKSPYAATKLAQEHLIEASAAAFDVRYVICRLFNNFGPGQQHNRLVPSAIRAALRNEPFQLCGDGTAVRDWIDVRDTCAAIAQIARLRCEGVPTRLNLGAECPLAVAEVLAEVEHTFQLRLCITRQDDMPGHLRTTIANSQLARDALGWLPTRHLRDYLNEVLELITSDHSRYLTPPAPGSPW